jgi:replicative DNA helicase
MFIYRPEYYGLTEDGDHRSTAGIAQIIVAKNRHGKTTEINLKFIDRLGKFADLDSLNDNYGEGGSFGAALAPNSEFDTPPPSQTITRGSRMDDISDVEAPF